MDIIETNSDGKNVEPPTTTAATTTTTTTTTPTSNEDVLVVLQTETGEQIALPVSALPSDFVPGDSSEIIVVESALDEQQQEVVVESSDLTDSQPHLENLVSVPPTIETLSPEEPPKPLRQKQKRKETLVTRPLNEEDMELKFQIIEEPSPMVQEVEVKRKPRKEYMTKKKVRLAMDKLPKEEDTKNGEEETRKGEEETKKGQEETKKGDQEGTKKNEEGTRKGEEGTKKGEEGTKKGEEGTKKGEEGTKKGEEGTRGIKRELPKRGVKEKSIEPTKPQPQPKQQQQPPPIQLERRTRLSNQCRVATGKSYECNDCDFSTDRINNIILHVKESCPILKKTNV